MAIILSFYHFNINIIYPSLTTTFYFAHAYSCIVWAFYSLFVFYLSLYVCYYLYLLYLAFTRKCLSLSCVSVPLSMLMAQEFHLGLIKFFLISLKVSCPPAHLFPLPQSAHSFSARLSFVPLPLVVLPCYPSYPASLFPCLFQTLAYLCGLLLPFLLLLFLSACCLPAFYLWLKAPIFDLTLHK